jgi:class 3 adenylate cyclase
VMTRPLCQTCGSENDAEARFCWSCGAALSAPAQASPGTRKVVTVLFSDVVGSTDLGEELDPESLRRVMKRYFGEMQTVLERHGGTIEKFIGDAIMAVFGVPRAHEDDAVRAVRAAAEMREALERLNKEFERDWGVRILTRTGLNTGEVIAEDATASGTFVTGDAVNVAARLEQAASPGEILISDGTLRLVRSLATVEPLRPLTVKGKTEPVSAWRLLQVAPGAPRWVPRFESPFVGRERELRELRAAFQRTVDGES